VATARTRPDLGLPAVWVSRTSPFAAESARRLAGLGYRAIAAPLLRVEFAPGGPDLARVGALVFTSRNGVAAFAARHPDRSLPVFRLPVFAVGDATARAARRAGFRHAASAAGDVAALRALVLARGRPADGVVLRVGAREPAGSLVADLAAAGFKVSEWAAYRTVDVPAPEVLGQLRAAAPAGAVLVYSPRAAGALARLLSTTRLGLRSIICISPAAAAALGADIACKVQVAERPDEASLFAALACVLPPSAYPPA